MDMPGAVMIKQTQPPFDVLVNWPGVEGGGWLLLQRLCLRATIHYYVLIGLTYFLEDYSRLIGARFTNIYQL